MMVSPFVEQYTCFPLLWYILTLFSAWARLRALVSAARHRCSANMVPSTVHSAVEDEVEDICE